MHIRQLLAISVFVISVWSIQANNQYTLELLLSKQTAGTLNAYEVRLLEKLQQKAYDRTKGNRGKQYKAAALAKRSGEYKLT